jgi:poly-gamma-glutamate synthesis protein (capsule biosynthesis protein)
VEFFKVAGFDVANLANNHIKDMGSGGVLDTLGILKEGGISTVGAGENLRDAREPLILERSCRRIAILSYAENEFSIADENSAGAANLDPISNLEQINRVSSENDVTIVLVHGGNEYCPVPSPRMRQRYRAFARAGASAILATHTHCPQGMEVIDGTPIAYSMGNFLFDTPYETGESSVDDMWWKGYLVKLCFTGRQFSSVELVSFSSGPDGTAVRFMEGKERDSFSGYIQHISDIIKDDAKLNNLWQAWCLKEGPLWMEYFRRAQYPVLGDDALLNTMILRNGFTCEAHHEVVYTFLRMICEDRLGEAGNYSDELRALQKGRY